MQTKGEEPDVRGGHTSHGVHDRNWRGGTSAACEARCPSLFDVACLESGDLTAHRRAAVLAHARRCPRCGLSLAELSQARREILGAAPATRSVQAQRAAQQIAEALRMRLH
ncbi:MAG: hypothetical protein ABJA82_11235 [Myxococcales bacterium]